MQKGISTQEELSGFKSALELLASNLDFHVNDSLSSAHGIDLIYGFIDSAGNDRRTYQDSFGQVISGTDPTKPNFIRFVVSGVAYYAPCQYNPAVDPGPQAAGTGSIQLTPQTSAVRATTLITDYVTYEIQAANGINAYVLAHAFLPQQPAHVTLSVVNTPLYASSGAVVGNFRIRLTWGGNVYEIPCDTRLGGPVQPPRMGAFNPNSASTHGDGQNLVMNKTFTPVVLGGTGPFTYSYEYLKLPGTPTAPIWQQFLSSLVPNVDDIHVPVWKADGADGTNPYIKCRYSDTTGVYFVHNASLIGRDDTHSRVRLTVTGPTGASTHTVYGTTTDLTIDYILIEDEPGSCFFFKTALAWQVPDFLEMDAKAEFYTPERKLGYKWMCHWGVPLMDRSRIFFNAVKFGIVEPFLRWGAFRYRKANRWGWIFALYCRAWLLLWQLLGKAVRRDVGAPPGWRKKARLHDDLHSEH